MDTILAGGLGVAFLLMCGGGLILTLRRGWYKPRYRNVRITKEDNPNQWAFTIVGYIFGCVMGLCFIAWAFKR